MARANYSEAVSHAATSLWCIAAFFIFLKFCGVIDWSWWGVLAPVYLPVVACLVLLAYFIFVGVVVVVVAFIGAVLERIIP